MRRNNIQTMGSTKVVISSVMMNGSISRMPQTCCERGPVVTEY